MSNNKQNNQIRTNEKGEKLLTEAEFRAKLIAEQALEKMKEEEKRIAENSGNDDFLELIISGCYYDSSKSSVDFDNVVIKVPTSHEDIATMHMMGRYAAKAIKAELKENGEPKYPVRIEKIRQIHVDDIKPVKGTYSFVGKDIKALNIDELQDLATAKDLRFIPLPQQGYSRRDMLINAYVDYAEKFLKKTIKWQEDDFNFAKLPSIILDSSVRVEEAGKITNDEIIEREQDNSTVDYGTRDDPRKRFTIEELKAIADSKKITYPNDIEFNSLYTRLFSA